MANEDTDNSIRSPERARLLLIYSVLLLLRLRLLNRVSRRGDFSVVFLFPARRRCSCWVRAAYMKVKHAELRRIESSVLYLAVASHATRHHPLSSHLGNPSVHSISSLLSPHPLYHCIPSPQAMFLPSNPPTDLPATTLPSAARPRNRGRASAHRTVPASGIYCRCAVAVR